MKYYAVAVDDEDADFFVEENERQTFIHGVKQVVLEESNFDDVERIIG